MDKTNLYYNAFQKYLLSNRLDIDLSKNKAIVKRYLAAEFADNCMEKANYYEIILKEMVKAVLK
jgi:carboxyl-terminal processing protease